MVSVCSIGGHRNELSARSVTATTLEADNWPFVGFHGCFRDYTATDGRPRGPHPALTWPSSGRNRLWGSFFPVVEEIRSKMLKVRAAPRSEPAGNQWRMEERSAEVEDSGM